MNEIDKMLGNIVGQKKSSKKINNFKFDQFDTMFNIKPIIKNKPTNNMFNIKPIIKNKPTNNMFNIKPIIKKQPTNNIINNFGLKSFGGKNDLDFDGIPNNRDCQPRNTMRQDKISKKVFVPKLTKANLYSISVWLNSSQSDLDLKNDLTNHGYTWNKLDYMEREELEKALFKVDPLSIKDALITLEESDITTQQQLNGILSNY